MDDWGTPGWLFVSFFNNTLTIADFTAQHNESRPVISRIFSFLVLYIGAFSTQVAVYFRIFLSFCICIIIYFLAKKDIKQNLNIFFAITIIIVFEPSQSYNMLFGMTFIGVVIPICILISIGLYYSELRSLIKIMFIIFLCIISTYTYANGMITWFLLNPFIINKIVRKKFILPFKYSVLFTTVGCLTIMYYFQEYIHPVSHPTIGIGINDPLRLLHFFAILIWSPFAISWFDYKLCSIFFSLVLIYLIFHYKEYLIASFLKKIILSRFECSMLMILLYGLCTCFSIALTRHEFGLKYALSEQYPSYAIWLHIGIIGLLMSIRYKKIPLLGNYALIFYFTLYLVGFEHNLKRFKEIGGRYKIAESAIYFSNVIPNNPFLKIATNKPEKHLIPKVDLFERNRLINTYDYKSSDLGLESAKEVQGKFNYRSDGKTIYFSGHVSKPSKVTDTDHLILFDYDSNKSLRPIIAVCFNGDIITNSYKNDIQSHSIVYFDHFISSEIEFVNPVACLVDATKNTLYRIND